MNETAPGAADGPIWSRSTWITPMGWMRDHAAAASMAQLIAGDGVFGSSKRLFPVPVSGAPAGALAKSSITMHSGDGSSGNGGSGVAGGVAGVGEGGGGGADPCMRALTLRIRAAQGIKGADVSDCGARELEDVAGAFGTAAACCASAAVGAARYFGPEAAGPGCVIGGGLCFLVVGHVVDKVAARCLKNAARMYNSNVLRAKALYQECCTSLGNCVDEIAP